MPADPEPFLQRIRAFPDDDAHRLILADWLDEQDDPAAADRALFIRVQLALAALPTDDPRRPDLTLTECQLLARRRGEWEAPFRGLATGLEFRRGFVDEARVPARLFVRRAAALFAAGPVRHLHLLDVGGWLPAVLRSPYLGRLAGLTAYAQHLRAELARGVAGCRRLAGLRELHLARNRLGDAGAAALAASPVLAGVEVLDLSENDIGEVGAAAVGGSPYFGKLRRLELAHNRVGAGGAAALAGSPRLPALERLGLADNRIGGPDLPALGGAAGLGRVPALDLTGNGLDPAGVRAVLAGDPGRLAELDLSHNPFGEAGAVAVADSPAAAGLRSLRLAGCDIPDAGVRALAGSPHLDRLTAIDLGNNPVGDPGFRAVLEAPGFRGLRRLVVPGVGVSPQTRAALGRRFPAGVVRF